MSLLSIVQDAADEIGIQRPTSVAGNSDPDAQKLLRLINKAGFGLMKEVAWQVLRKEQTFTALNQEAQTSILPSDFDRFVPETFWDRTNIRYLSGPVHGTEWQGLKATNYNDERRKYALRGDSILVIPVPDGGETYAFEYVSNQWCQSSDGSGQTAFAADADTGVLDEELLTRALRLAYLIAEGLPADAAMMDFKDYYDTLRDNDQPDGNILVAGDLFGRGSRHFTGAPAVNSDYSLF